MADKKVTLRKGDMFAELSDAKQIAEAKKDGWREVKIVEPEKTEPDAPKKKGAKVEKTESETPQDDGEETGGDDDGDGTDTSDETTGERGKTE